MKARIVIVITFLFFAGALLWIFGKSGSEVSPEVTPFPTQAAPPASTSSASLSAAPSVPLKPSPQVKSLQTSESQTGRREALWKEFREKFGEELKPQFDKDGHLIAVRGAPGVGRRAGTDFNPQDPQKAIARAREVLEAASELLGLQSDLPLESPIARGNAISAQVFFRESQGGVSLAPMGVVTVDQGPQGELLNLDSNYIRDVQIVNEVRIDAEQAKAKAAVSVADQSAPMKPRGGGSVIWVTPSPSRGAPEGRHAFEYTVQGRQVIVDASNGNVLFKRDRREFF